MKFRSTSIQFNHSIIIVNGFLAAGIVDAVEGQLNVSPAKAPSDDDPFAEVTDDQLDPFMIIL